MYALNNFLQSRIYKLFISHAWNYDDEYKGVVRLLKLDVTFNWIDLSVPVENPLPLHPILRKSHRNILRQLEAKIQEADCLLVLAAMYFNHSGWIQSEIEIARDYHKPIIAVRPQGQERVPEALNQIGISELVGWNKSSIISAIRKYATPTGKPSLLTPPVQATGALLTPLPSRPSPLLAPPPAPRGSLDALKSALGNGSLPYLNDLVPTNNLLAPAGAIPTPTQTSESERLYPHLYNLLRLLK